MKRINFITYLYFLLIYGVFIHGDEYGSEKQQKLLIDQSLDKQETILISKYHENTNIGHHHDHHKNNQEAYRGLLSKKTQSMSKSTISFVPWPHLKIFDGYLKNGIWIAGDADSMKNKLNQDFDNLDEIQKYAIKDGIFIPSKKNFPNFHIFSSTEANQCLNGKKLYVTGDSYMVQMFIGLTEIILGAPSNEQIRDGKHREDLLISLEKNVKKLFASTNSKTQVRFLYYHCHLQDFTCINGEMIDDNTWKEADALVASVAIHYKGLHILDPLMIDHYGLEVGHFFKTSEEKKLTWVTGLSYHKAFNTSVVLINFKAMEEAKKANVPLLDIFTLTETCVLLNCSTDGGHKSRYVNRMKAQFLLNNLCRIEI